MKRQEFAIGLALLAVCCLSQFTVATATRSGDKMMWKHKKKPCKKRSNQK